MNKSIYTYYKERLVEIGGGSRCICLKGIAKQSSYDLGRIFEGRDAKVAKFVDFLWSANGRFPFTVINRDEKREILENIDIESRIASARESSKYIDSPKSSQSGRRDGGARTIEAEISHLSLLAREVEEIERETGKKELFVGYPFVFGAIKQGGKPLKIKAPLLLFPVKIEFQDADTADIRFNEREKIHINPALVYAYAQSKRINLDRLELSFDRMDDFRSIQDVIEYLGNAGIKIDFNSSKNVYTYSHFKEPEDKLELSVRFAAVLGRFPLSNSIYNDYTMLEKHKDTNASIDELLKTDKPKSRKPFLFFGKKGKKTPSKTYTVKPLDFTQSEVVRRIDECGNMVVWGPPGTGKSQTIVNIISDAVTKGKKILVVSQKKAALDVVYNRLGSLSEKCMYVNDETKEKAVFYDKCLTSHLRTMGTHTASEGELIERHGEICSEIDAELAKLDAISDALNQKRHFGLSLSEMYTSSVMLNKNSNDYAIYQRLVERGDIMSLDYKALSSALSDIKSHGITKIYFDYLAAKEKNPLIALTQPGVDIHTISEVKGKLEVVEKSRRQPFDTERYPYFRQVLAHYNDLGNERVLDSMVKLECKAKYPKKIFLGKLRTQMRESFVETINAIEEFARDYSFLHLMFSDEGFVSIIDNLVRGNSSYMKLVFEAINSYVAMRDIKTLLDSFNKDITNILAFSYSLSKGYSSFVGVVESILPLRIYHEVIYLEELCKDDLAKTVDYPNIKSRIIELTKESEELSQKIAALAGTHGYTEFYGKSARNKDYLYQISKKQKFWPIRKTMEVYGEFLLNLFPCWLLSPENVSSLLPLKKNMFDLVLFDEASQVFIECTIPAIYRGKNIVVAGDSKQLRPSSTFMKRYLGQYSDGDDLAKEAALEVESLLDLAVARYESATLTYHYRSNKSELIDFSNAAFYKSSLVVAPNVSKNEKSKAIERIMVDGSFIERKNEIEAERVVKLLSEILETRRDGETVGIITFNSEQQSCISDKIDRECERNAQFRDRIAAERHRFENGEDVSLFIKNLENVQGEERDIIIFSVGYAKNADGKVHTGFGSLSAEGGENRLNVAITRAKRKIYVITSIEPSELKVDDAKNNGPKLLRKYLEYVKAVSLGKSDEVKAILKELNPSKSSGEDDIPSRRDIAASMKERLEKLGLEVDVSLGNAESKISLGIYDRDEDRYLLGVELDCDAYASSESTLERDVFKPRFLESRGFSIMRVWCRDYWLSPNRVIKSIAAVAEANKAQK